MTNGGRLPKLIAVLLSLLFITVLTTSVYAQCGCGPCCPDHFTALDTDKDTYQAGAQITFTFSNPQNYDVVFERIYIQRWQPFPWAGGAVVYSYEFVDFDQSAVPGASWIWTWDQQSNWGNQVSPGRYVMVIETLCCGTYKVSFRIADSCYRPCTPCYWSCWTCYRPCRPCCPPPTCLEPREPDFFQKHFLHTTDFGRKEKVTLRIKEHVMNQLCQMAGSFTFREAPANSVVWTENGVMGWRNDSLSEVGLSLDPATGKISGYLTPGLYGENYFFFMEALNSEGEVIAGIWIEIAFT